MASPNTLAMRYSQPARKQYVISTGKVPHRSATRREKQLAKAEAARQARANAIANGLGARGSHRR
jgi:hypothetical protein